MAFHRLDTAKHLKENICIEQNERTNFTGANRGQGCTI